MSKFMQALQRFFRHEQGYTLVVIAAVFAAFAIGMAAYLDRSVQGKAVATKTEARNQLTVLQTALIRYANEHSGRYPCPARPDVPMTDSSFGTAVSNCHTGTPTGIVILSGSTEVIRGMVPVQTLAGYGLTAADAFDQWGNRIMYVVNRELTPGGSGTATDRPSITEGNLNTEIPDPDFILLSYGQDRQGGYQRVQTAPTLATGPSVPCASASTEKRQENCDDDLNFILSSTYTLANATSSNYFDDQLSYYLADIATASSGENLLYNFPGRSTAYSWEVPEDGTYKIYVWGSGNYGSYIDYRACGYDSYFTMYYATGGSGALTIAERTLTAGETLTINAAQNPATSSTVTIPSSSTLTAGGGGTVTNTSNCPDCGSCTISFIPAAGGTASGGDININGSAGKVSTTSMVGNDGGGTHGGTGHRTAGSPGAPGYDGLSGGHGGSTGTSNYSTGPGAGGQPQFPHYASGSYGAGAVTITKSLPYVRSYPARAASYTWTVPENGTYRFYAWGAGSVGASFDLRGCIGSIYSASGASGGLAVVDKTLTAGESVTLAVGLASGATTTVTFPSGTPLSAGGGGTGNATCSYEFTPAAGGVASGGDTNINGSDGKVFSSSVAGNAGGGTHGGLGHPTHGTPGAPGHDGLYGGTGGSGYTRSSTPGAGGSVLYTSHPQQGIHGEGLVIIRRM